MYIKTITRISVVMYQNHHRTAYQKQIRNTVFGSAKDCISETDP